MSKLHILFFYHEIKSRVAIVFFGLFFNFFVFYRNKENLLFFLTSPIVSSKSLCSELSFKNIGLVNKVSELFDVYYEIVLSFTCQATALQLFFHAILFLTPSFKTFDVKFLNRFFAFFALGWLLTPFALSVLLLPTSLDFLLGLVDDYNQKSPLQTTFAAGLFNYWIFCKELQLNCLELLTSTFCVLVIAESTCKFKKSSKNSHRKVFYSLFLGISFSSFLNFPAQFFLIIVSVLVYEFFQLLVCFQLGSQLKLISTPTTKSK